MFITLMLHAVLCNFKCSIHFVNVFQGRIRKLRSTVLRTISNTKYEIEFYISCNYNMHQVGVLADKKDVEVAEIGNMNKLLSMQFSCLPCEL